MKVLILGGTGLLGSNWVYLAAKRHQVSVLVGVRNIDFDDVVIYKGLDSLEYAIEKECPDVVVNAIGFTDVEGCEAQPLIALKLNAELPIRIAKLQVKHAFLLVHVSTDHLFPAVEQIWSETDVPNPVNVYGSSKFLGENAVTEIAEKSLVIRSNFFGWGHSYRKSFSDWTLDQFRTKQTFTGYTDVMFTPVLVDQLIESVESLIERNQTGVFNIASSQVVSKFEFIKMLAIAFGLHSDMVTPGLVAASRGSIVRPQYMGLNADKLERTLGTTLELSDGMSRLVDTSERSLILRRAVS